MADPAPPPINNPNDLYFVYYVGHECHVIIGSSNRPIKPVVNQMCAAGLTQEKIYGIYDGIPFDVHIRKEKR